MPHFVLNCLLNFWTKLTQKGYFWSKKKEKENYHWILHIWINLGSKFQLKQTTLIFGTNSQRTNSLVEIRQKNEHHHWIVHIRISVNTNFQRKLAILFFWPNLPKNGSYFQSKTDKTDTTIEFCIFALDFVLNSTLNKQFWIIGLNLPKEDIYGQKQEKWTSLNFVCLN